MVQKVQKVEVHISGDNRSIKVTPIPPVKPCGYPLNPEKGTQNPPHFHIPLKGMRP